MYLSSVHTKTLLFAWPILPGKEEAWRRFMQEIQEIHPEEFAESRRRHGIRKEYAHLAAATQLHIAIMTIESEDPEQVLLRLSNSEHPFDHWFRQQVLALHGLDLKSPAVIPRAELVLTWRAPFADR